MAPTVRARGWAALILVIYGVLLAVALIIPRPIDHGFTPWVRSVLAFARGRGLPGFFTYDFVEYASHAVMFVPLGILAVVAFGRLWSWLAVLLVVGIGVLVEYGPSYLMHKTTPASRLDLLLNVVGAVLGLAIGFAVLTGLRRSPGPRERMPPAAAPSR